MKKWLKLKIVIAVFAALLVIILPGTVVASVDSHVGTATLAYAEAAACITPIGPADLDLVAQIEDAKTFAASIQVPCSISLISMDCGNFTGAPNSNCELRGMTLKIPLDNGTVVFLSAYVAFYDIGQDAANGHFPRHINDFGRMNDQRNAGYVVLKEPTDAATMTATCGDRFFA